MRAYDQYDVRVGADGKWAVNWVHGYDQCDRTQVGIGVAEDQLRGELAARAAIIDHKTTLAKRAVHASGERTFTVKA